MSDCRKENDEGVSCVAWFITGALIGATIGVLYAPKSGKETRKYLADRAHKGCEAVEGVGDAIADSSREMFERGRKLVEDAAELFERGRKLVKG